MTPEELLRRYAPSLRRELVADLREALAGTDDPATRQALYDAATQAAGVVAGDDQEALTGLVGDLHNVTFPKVDTVPEGWRRLAVDRHPELADVFTGIEAATSDAERSEIVLAAIASGRFDGDPQALGGLVALDPSVDARLEFGDDHDALAERDRAETDQRLAEAAATLNVGESPARRMLREHLEAAEQQTVNA